MARPAKKKKEEETLKEEVQIFTVEGGIGQKIYMSETDYVEIIEQSNDKKNPFAARAIEASKKYIDYFNSNTFSAPTLEEAVRLGNMNLSRLEILMEEEAQKSEEQKAAEKAAMKPWIKKSSSSLNDGYGIR